MENRRKNVTRSCFSLDMDTFEQTKDAIRNDPNLKRAYLGM